MAHHEPSGLPRQIGYNGYFWFTNVAGWGSVSFRYGQGKPYGQTVRGRSSPLTRKRSEDAWQRHRIESAAPVIAGRRPNSSSRPWQVLAQNRAGVAMARRAGMPTAPPRSNAATHIIIGVTPQRSNQPMVRLLFFGQETGQRDPEGKPQSFPYLRRSPDGGNKACMD